MSCPTQPKLAAQCPRMLCMGGLGTWHRAQGQALAVDMPENGRSQGKATASKPLWCKEYNRTHQCDSIMHELSPELTHLVP